MNFVLDPRSLASGKISDKQAYVFVWRTEATLNHKTEITARLWQHKLRMRK